MVIDNSQIREAMDMVGIEEDRLQVFDQVKAIVGVIAQQVAAEMEKQREQDGAHGKTRSRA